MNNRFCFEPENDTATPYSLLIPSTLVVYPSGAVPGAVSITMTQDGRSIEAGTRLTREQASDLARALVQILGTEDEDPHTLAYDIGHAAGYKAGEAEGFNAGWDQGHDEGNSDGWDDGYELGYERGYEAGTEEVA
jgi:hypothetical protein